VIKGDVTRLALIRSEPASRQHPWKITQHWHVLRIVPIVEFLFSLWVDIHRANDDATCIFRRWLIARVNLLKVPFEQFSVVSRYGGPSLKIGKVFVLIRLGTRKFYDFSPPLGFFGYKLTEINRRTGKRCTTQLTKPRLHSRISQSSIGVFVELGDDFQ
jgi:hypothetical protein